MMDRRIKPTVINLADDLKRKANTANTSRNRIKERDIDVQKPRTLEPSDKKQGNFYLTSDFDVELKNDFKWLINFNLKDILGCGIDEEICNKSKTKKQQESRSKENVDKQDYRSPLIEILEQCLVGKEGVTVREIFKWISGRYPCFQSKDYKWKNLVRKTLAKNPLFKSRKSRRGRNDIWYLDRNGSKGSNFDCQQNILSETEGSWVKPRLPRPPATRGDWTSGMSKRDRDYYHPFGENASYKMAIDDIETSVVELYSTENWIETTGYQDKDDMQVVKQEGPPEYYEMQAALTTEFAEPLQVVSFLDENTTPVTMELL